VSDRAREPKVPKMTDEELHKLLKDASKAPASARHLGFELIGYSVEEKWAEMAFHPRPEFANPAGTVQGGFIAAMLDDAMGFTASVSTRFEIMVPTLQMTVSFLRPVPIARVLARGEVLRMGASSVQMQGTLKLSDGTIAATALASAATRPYPK
jgi:uncharacterized protein (TIGR00369 family)